MTPIEKGVYIDLIMYYYSVERPITQDECNRIARGYANAEAEAMQYVLQHHFIKDGDCYRHRKCDEVLSSGSAISGKRSEAARIRWEKERARRAAQKESSKNGASEDANAVLTSNHKPVTITIEEKVEKEAKKAKREPTVSFPDSHSYGMASGCFEYPPGRDAGESFSEAPRQVCAHDHQKDDGQLAKNFHRLDRQRVPGDGQDSTKPQAGFYGNSIR